MNPDAIVDLQLDLVRCYLNETGLVLGGLTWSAEDIKVMLETLDIWMLPCANPDGREYVMTADDMWRQNRRDNPGTACDGVDVNRNFDFVWGVTTSNTSCNPCLETFVGAGAFSEPESQNIKHLCDTYRIDVFVDVHSYSELSIVSMGPRPNTNHRFQPAVHQSRDWDLHAIEPVRPSGVSFAAGPASFPNRRAENRGGDPGGPRAELHPAARPGALRHHRHELGLRLQPPYREPSASQDLWLRIETGPFVGNLRDSFHPTDRLS